MSFVKQRISLSLNAIAHIKILDGEQDPPGEDKTPHCH